MASEMTFIQTKKQVSETLADLRRLFAKAGIDDWEPVPAEKEPGYAVRYFRNGSWTEIGSYYQPTKAMNLRVCYQVIDNMLRWEARGVTGLIKGTAFMGGAVVAIHGGERENFEEACAIIGVDPVASLEEAEKIYQIKVQFCHPDKLTHAMPEEKKTGEERFKRLTAAIAYIRKVKGKK